MICVCVCVLGEGSAEVTDKLRRVGWFQESKNVNRDVGDELV